MKQYLVIGRDGNDSEALQRRMQARAAHLAGAAALKANGNFVLGGALLNDAEQMEGSMLIVQFHTQQAFDEWFKTEPYIVQQVWQQIEIKPFKVADIE